MPDPPAFEPRSPFETAFRTAIEGADAYRAVRAGLRLHDDILRIGNRFVSVDKFREIGFVALGNAAGAMALAAQEMLGERLTQGLSAGAVAAPETLQFQHQMVPDPWPGSAPAEGARESALELAGGLHAGDLLLVLLSAGAFSVTAGPPSGWDPAEWRRLLQRVTAGSGPVDAVRVARVLGTGAVGGRLAAIVGDALVVTLVVDRGEGPEWVGGGPTIPLRPEEPASVKALLSGTPVAASVRDPGVLVGRNVHRPVVVTGPADAVEAAGNLLASQGWISRLVSLHLVGSPEEVATQFVRGMETIRREQVGEPIRSTTAPVEGGTESSSEAALEAFGEDIRFRGTSQAPNPRHPKSRGLAGFAATTFSTVEGGERGDEVRAFLSATARELVRRETYAGALRTAGGIPERGAGAGSWLARRSGSDLPTAPTIETYSVRPGFTDVGTVLVAFLPWGAR
ncbi:MAG: DUF4147 domain-containing protein [Thermoplasmata archaeon]|nr:DUF4147 domain-containing protein [Thermoplasmata archaeon]